MGLKKEYFLRVKSIKFVKVWTLSDEGSQKFQHFGSESNEKSSFISIYELYRIIIQQVVTKVKVSTATLSIF